MSDRIVPKFIASRLPIIDIDYSIVDIRIIVPEIVWLIASNTTKWKPKLTFQWSEVFKLKDLNISELAVLKCGHTFCVSIIFLPHLRKSQTQYVITEIGVHGPSLVNKVYTLFEETVKNFEW